MFVKQRKDNSKVFIVSNDKFKWLDRRYNDINILEHAYKSYGKLQPWKFYRVRDSRTVLSLWPERPVPPTSHHALEDTRKQIDILQQTLKHLNVKDIR